MGLFAIGDIHGCRTALDALLHEVQLGADDTVVPLGDYVDRGPDSAGVLERLLELRRHTTVLPLLGNHERMMLDARTFPRARDLWLRVGGRETLASYAAAAGRFELAERAAFARADPVVDELLSMVPDDHWRFLEEDCARLRVVAGTAFVHGCLDPDQSLDEQTDDVLLWRKFWDPPPRSDGIEFVCGHTPQADRLPRDLGHAICIDTMAFAGDGWLSCLDVDSRAVVQANERGDVRRVSP